MSYPKLRDLLAEAEVHLVQTLLTIRDDPGAGLQGYLEEPRGAPNTILAQISWPMTVMLVTLYCRRHLGKDWTYCRNAVVSWRGAWVDYNEGRVPCGSQVS